MKVTSIILTILTLGVLSSCMAADNEAMPYESILVEGLVVDENGNHIDHIKIMMEWDSPFSPMAVYSSPKGIFTAELRFYNLAYPATVSVEISDIDGDENGGLFQTRKDEIIILEENYSGSTAEPITYQLTHATASESSQQSL